jgi:hypothetical protein
VGCAGNGGVQTAQLNRSAGTALRDILLAMKSCTKNARFKWTPQTKKAAALLAEGYTRQHVADEVGASLRTVYNWLDAIEFSAEVDRLSCMLSTANRAERLRIAHRAARQAMRKDGTIDTNRDILDWLKFSQSETDGQKLDLTKLAAAFAGDDAPMADRGPAGSGSEE